MRSRLLTDRFSLRRGSITPLTILCLSLLVGVVALVIDGGTLMEDRRHVQATADAAALAAAADLYTNYAGNQCIDPGGSARSSALATAAANGFGNDGVHSVVTVNVSPQNYQGGPNAGKPLPPGYVEVIIQYNASHLFSGVFGTGTTSVRGRAVARGQWLPISNNVIVLNLNNPAVLGATGNGSLQIKGGLQINSKSRNAVNLGGNFSLSASSLNLNQISGSNLFSNLLSSLMGAGVPSSTVTLNGAIADPLRYLPPPDPVQLGLSLQGTNFKVNNGTVDLYPGVYQGGISVSGAATVKLHANAGGTPGIYYLQGGGFSTSDKASVVMAPDATAGVMIYNAWQGGNGSLNFVASGPLVLTPPTSGVYEGITIFQQRGTPSQAGPAVNISGQGNVNVTGTIYAAYADIHLNGLSGTNVMGGQVIADTLRVSGNASVAVNTSVYPVAHTRIFGLVE
jgi:Flp pilus assembly protein TadG